MSGHSKWATTHRQKAVVDAKRGAIFTKIGNQIAIAARAGTDPTMNSSLAMAIEKAKAANIRLPISSERSTGLPTKNLATLEENYLRGLWPGGVGIIIETATDNRNRTLPEVKLALTKTAVQWLMLAA